MSKTHYFVAEYRTHVEGKLLKQFFTSKDDFKLHWWERPSYCTRDGLRDFKIIRDFGWVDAAEDYDTYDDIWNTYYKEFPPTAFDIKTAENWDVMGWISPEGILYPCGFMGHTSLARDIINSFYGAEYAFIESRYLFEKGWFELSDGGLLRGLYEDKRNYLTPKQEKILVDIIQKHPNSEFVDNLIENMQLWIKEEKNV